MAAAEHTRPLIDEPDYRAPEVEVSRRFALRHSRIVAASLAAAMAIAACGQSSHSSSGTESNTTTSSTVEQPTPAKKPPKVVRLVSTSILPNQQLNETIYAILGATKKPPTESNVAKVDNFLVKNNNSQSFVPGSHNTRLQALQTLLLPVNPGHQYSVYKKGLHNQMVKVARETNCTDLPTTDTPSTDTTFEVTPSCVTATQLGASWHAGCPVQPDQLEGLTMDYIGMDKNTYKGTLIVKASIANKVTKVFATLFESKFRIRQMLPISVYNGDATVSASQDNTSAFDCPPSNPIAPNAWPQEAYGTVININPVENTSVPAAPATPAAGTVDLRRADHRPGLAIAGKTLVNAMMAVGAQWGGAGSGTDYQQFTFGK